MAQEMGSQLGARSPLLPPLRRRQTGQISAGHAVSLLTSLGAGYRATVFGASAGIGAELVRLLQSDPNCAAVHVGARIAPAAGAKLISFAFDLCDERSIEAAAQAIAARSPEIDLVIVATGLLHSAALAPEKTMHALKGGDLQHVYMINAIGPILIAKHMLPLLPRDRKSVFAALSARVGSIADNRRGGWHGYRASKAALNQLVRTCAIELAMKYKRAVCVTLHPGTVETALSRPFQARVPKEQLFSAKQSAAYLVRVIDGLSTAQSAQLVAWNGTIIPF